MPVNVILFVLCLAIALGSAVMYGGQPERWTAGMFAIASLASHLAYAAPGQRYYTVESYVAAVDLLLFAGIIIILAKADRFWPIALFAIHGVTVLAHIIKLLDARIIRQAYAISIAAPGYLAILTLILGVVRHQQRLRTFGADLDWSDHA